MILFFKRHLDFIRNDSFFKNSKILINEPSTDPHAYDDMASVSCELPFGKLKLRLYARVNKQDWLRKDSSHIIKAQFWLESLFLAEDKHGIDNVEAIVRTVNNFKHAVGNPFLVCTRNIPTREILQYISHLNATSSVEFLEIVGKMIFGLLKNARHLTSEELLALYNKGEEFGVTPAQILDIGVRLENNIKIAGELK